MNSEDLRRAFAQSNPQIPPIGSDSPPLLSGVQSNMGMESSDIGIGNKQILEPISGGLNGNIVDAVGKFTTNLTGSDLNGMVQVNHGPTAPNIGDVTGNTKGVDVSTSGGGLGK
jgi:hypothetical protein